ncbi:P-loop NTPase fold protein [Aliarcobacter butzleri]|uniref:P-loop NTPase fold protein n=1 Tax=Aliarcobacter butzleri TaxID=28197 RepID=UPI003AF70336
MNFILDEEIGLTEENDILETKRYANSLKEIILNAPTPFNIGLYGEWGSGKSSIIKTAQVQLESNKEQKFKFVIYDAWKYANDSFRRMFLKTLQEQLKFDGTELFESFYRNKTQDTKINPKLNYKSLGITIVLLILTFVMIGSLQLETKWELTLQSIVAFGSMIIAFYKNIFTDYKVTIQKPIMFAPEQFEDAFKDMMSKSLKKHNIFSLATEYVKGNHYEKEIDKLVIVIDNIDRCDKKTAYELLTNIKNFIGTEKGIIFLVPVDDEALKRHMQEHNKENSKEADEFLRKFFNTTIKIKHFQPRDLFEFANKLNSKNQLGFTPDTINIVAKEYASNPRRIIQLFNNLTAELKTIESKFEKSFIEEHQSLIAKLLIIREEWADVFKEITKHPHLFYKFETVKIFQDEKEINLDNFKRFMEITRAVNANLKTIENIILNITNESTLSNEIISLIESNNFDELKLAFEKDSSLFDNITNYAIEEIRKGLDRKTYSTDAINGIKLLSKLNEYQALQKAPLSELFGFFNKEKETLQVIEYLQKDDLDSFFKFIEQNRVYGLPYLQNKITTKFKEIWREKPKEHIVSLYEDGIDKFINNSADEKVIQELQSIFINYYEYFKDAPLYKYEWINENKLNLIISNELITHIINKIITPIIDIKSDVYLEIEYLTKHKIIDIKKIELLFERIKPNFSQQITVQADMNGEKQQQLDNLMNNIQIMTGLLRNMEKVKYESEVFTSYIKEFLKPVQIMQNNTRQQVTLNVIGDVSSNTDYQEILLNFYIEIYKITYNNTDVTTYIQTLINQCQELKNIFYNKLIELRDIYQLTLVPFFDYLLSQKDESENLFNLYEKLFNRDNISSEQIEKIKIKLDGYINQLIKNSNKDIENFIDKLMLQNKTKDFLTDIIISKETQDIIKLPQNIKKVAYSHLCKNNKIFDIENNIEAICDIVETSDEYNNCILNIITRKLANPQEVVDALSIINKMQNISNEIKKEILIGLNKQKKHESLSDMVKELIKELDNNK